MSEKETWSETVLVVLDQIKRQLPSGAASEPGGALDLWTRGRAAGGGGSDRGCRPWYDPHPGLGSPPLSGLFSVSRHASIRTKPSQYSCVVCALWIPASIIWVDESIVWRGTHDSSKTCADVLLRFRLIAVGFKKQGWKTFALLVTRSLLCQI